MSDKKCINILGLALLSERIVDEQGVAFGKSSPIAGIITGPPQLALKKVEVDRIIKDFLENHLIMHS